MADDGGARVPYGGLRKGGYLHIPVEQPLEISREQHCCRADGQGRVVVPIGIIYILRSCGPVPLTAQRRLLGSPAARDSSTEELPELLQWVTPKGLTHCSVGSARGHLGQCRLDLRDLGF